MSILYTKENYRDNVFFNGCGLSMASPKSDETRPRWARQMRWAVLCGLPDEVIHDLNPEYDTQELNKQIKWFRNKSPNENINAALSLATDMGAKSFANFLKEERGRERYGGQKEKPPELTSSSFPYKKTKQSNATGQSPKKSVTPSDNQTTKTTLDSKPNRDQKLEKAKMSNVKTSTTFPSSLTKPPPGGVSLKNNNNEGRVYIPRDRASEKNNGDNGSEGSPSATESTFVKENKNPLMTGATVLKKKKNPLKTGSTFKPPFLCETPPPPEKGSKNDDITCESKATFKTDVISDKNDSENDDITCETKPTVKTDEILRPPSGLIFANKSEKKEMKVDDSFCSGVPFLQEGKLTLLCAPAESGKTTLLRHVYKEFLRDSGATVACITENVDTAIPQQRGVMRVAGVDDTDWEHRFAVGDGSYDNSNELVKQLNQLAAYSHKGGIRKLLISIDTLTNLVSGIDTEINFNDRNQIGDLLKKLKSCAIRYTSRGLDTAIVIAHHPTKVNPKNPSGSAAIKSQANIRSYSSLNFQSREITVEWGGQDINKGSCGYKFNEALTAAHVTEGGVISEELKGVDKELSRRCEVYAAIVTGYVSDVDINQTRLTYMLGRGDKTVSDACYALWRDGYISKYDKPPLTPKLGVEDLKVSDKESAKNLIDDFCETVGQPYLDAVLIKDPMKKGGYKLELTACAYRDRKGS